MKLQQFIIFILLKVNLLFDLKGILIQPETKEIDLN